MTRRFIVRPRAEHDIQSAYQVDQKLGAVRDFPEANPVLYRDIRRAVISRFPYLIFYVVRPSRIAVLAVLHHARDPAVWPQR